ncbi:MAG: isoprenylcysteine carboxylmethyltransferase family protein [Microcoleus vaginatus WJT46-NPBG5]|jgi:protein-S-isoprenylcysteine O-methyltransferase Ste14|nr:isoprenylcysteine carboxylmethyltransferase family protein [Microcoleus vaginatus WJT46-NPBG5]
MNSFVKVLQLSLGLAGSITLLIVLPAILFGVITQWQVIFLSLGYLCFFLSTVWRVIRHGDLSSKREDQQVQRTSGRLASLVLLVGLLSVHWLAVYDFSRLESLEASTGNIFLVILSVLLLISSIAVSQAAIATLGKFFDRLTIKPDHQLVDAGIYSAVRHPIYLSYILLFTAFCIMLQSPASLGLLAVVCAIWFGNRIMIEEEMLIDQFGDEYKIYQQKTKKLLPFIY